jgi:HSP20 family protein
MMLASLRNFWDVQSEADRLFDSMVSAVLGGRRGGGEQNRPWVPPMESYARKGDLVIRVDLPGVALEEVDVALEGGMLTISGIRKVQTEDGATHYLEELPHGEFRRSVAIPEVAASDSVKARLENGVLDVVLPGAVDESQTKKEIVIETGGEPGSIES